MVQIYRIQAAALVLSVATAAQTVPAFAAAPPVTQGTAALLETRKFSPVALTNVEPGFSGGAYGGADSAAFEKPSSSLGLKGYVQSEVARTVASPAHWSKMLTRAEFGTQGQSGDRLKWKLSARIDYDAVYDLYDYYPSEVRKDQRLNFSLRENYVDFGAGNWDFRLGRQQVVWGEIVGFFVADVVSAKDLRQFILPDFDTLRIPQWAARAEYSANDFHAEVLWIPFPSYDKMGKPGAEFFPTPPPAPPGLATVVLGESRPSRNLSNTNYGARVGTMRNGWDLSAFYYRSVDASATFYREIRTTPQPAVVYQARHDRIHQLGATLTKDLGSVVLKGEGVYTRGRQFNVFRASDNDGVVPHNSIDWVVGVDFTLPRESRLNLQYFQRVLLDADPDILSKPRETGYTIYFNTKVADRVEAQVLWIASLERSDWLLRPKVSWNFEKNWLLSAGADIFHGPPVGVFGRFDNRDRVYTELRYSF